jgi:hypothetical protein
LPLRPRLPPPNKPAPLALPLRLLTRLLRLPPRLTLLPLRPLPRLTLLPFRLPLSMPPRLLSKKPRSNLLHE